MATKQTKLTKTKCKYGANCYRKNADHLKAFSHPKRKGDDDDEEEGGDIGSAGDQPKRVKLDPESSETGVKGDKQVETTSDEEKETSKDVEETADTAETSESESEEEEGDDVDIPAGDVKAFIKHKYQMEMPTDFYEFWEFCKKEKPDSPADAFEKTLGFRLVGPYDILAGRHEGVITNKRGKKVNYLRHWRYYYDPPEFQTVVKGDDTTQFHIGYYRDDPGEMPVFLAANSAKTNCTLTPRGDNIFAAISYYLKEKRKNKETDGATKKKLEGLCERLEKWAEGQSLSLDVRSKSMKARQRKVVCDTFHAAGIVVPVDEHEVGYRPVPETPGDLKKILKKIIESKTETERNKNFDPLQELITLVQFANDECDYGEGLELGLDLFSYGGDVFHSTISQLLPLAYQLLRRPQFGRIISAHLRRRTRSADLSELD